DIPITRQVGPNRSPRLTQLSRCGIARNRGLLCEPSHMWRTAAILRFLPVSRARFRREASMLRKLLLVAALFAASPMLCASEAAAQCAPRDLIKTLGNTRATSAIAP